ncbi:Type II secretion system protein D [compost metagenome]
MVFLRPTVIRNAAGMAALSGKKYSDIRVLGNVRDGYTPGILPSDPNKLFDSSDPAAIDLRE